jgi:hypothetical protein
VLPIAIDLIELCASSCASTVVRRATAAATATFVVLLLAVPVMLLAVLLLLLLRHVLLVTVTAFGTTWAPTSASHMRASLNSCHTAGTDHALCVRTTTTAATGPRQEACASCQSSSGRW